MLERQGKLLRVFVGENDRREGLPLYEWLVRQAHQRGMAGVTVMHGSEGYGARNQLHTARVLRLSVDLPIVVEMVDSAEKIDAFLSLLDEVLMGGVAVVQDAEVHFYGSKGQG